jgi:DNA repair exonuclease SbcCD ATPase subunit
LPCDYSEKDQQITKLSKEETPCKKIQRRLKEIAKNARLQLKTCEAKSCPPTLPCDYSEKDQQITKLSQDVKSLQAQLVSKEETLTTVKELAKYTQGQLNTCRDKLDKTSDDKPDTCPPPPCDCSEKEQKIAECSKVIESLKTQKKKQFDKLIKKMTTCENQVQELTAVNNRPVDQDAELKNLRSELKEAVQIIISLTIENLLAQNTCDDIRISIPDGEEIRIIGVSSSRERIANLKKRAENNPHFSLGKFEVNYIDTNRCIIRLSDNWAIIAKENGDIEELSYNEGTEGYLRQLPSYRNCAKIGEVLQNSDKGPRQFFGDDVQPQIWALKKGAVGICRGTENRGLYEWSFKRGHEGYSALLVIKRSNNE